MTIGSIRRDFPALANCIHLNSAGISPTPRRVTDELFRLHQYVSEHGTALLLAEDESLVRREASHQAAADFLGVDADEIAFTSQFSAGVSLVFEGLAWRPGDEIIISDQEHPAMLIPLLNIARRRGLVIRKFPVVHDSPAMLASLSDLLNERTRLVAVSHVTTEDGTRLPAAEICRLSHQNDTLVLFDGAQALGQFPVSLREMDCDFYAFLGYKWLFGPFTSAGIFIKRELIDRVEVTWTGSRATKSAGIDMDSFEFIRGARRFEFGGRPYAEESAMATGMQFVAEIGLDAIEEHARRLSLYLHEALAEVKGSRIHSPLEPQQMTGIVTFSVEGVSGAALAPALRDRWSVLTRPALNDTGVRASIAAFTSERDLDLLVEAVSTVAEDGLPPA